MNKIKELREQKGLSLQGLKEELAEKENFEVGKASLNNYERGEQTPKTETWKKLANYFEVSVPYIMGLSDTKREIDEEASNNYLYQLLLKNMLLNNDDVKELNIADDMKDLTGKKLFEKYDGNFNTQEATCKIVQSHFPIIKGSNNRKAAYILNLNDPVTNKLRVTCLTANFYLDQLDVTISESNMTYKMLIHLYLPSQFEATNVFNDFYFNGGKVSGYDEKEKNFDPFLSLHFLKFKEMFDSENGNTNEIDKFLQYFIDYSFKILCKERSDIFQENSVNTYQFEINYLNESTKLITIDPNQSK